MLEGKLTNEDIKRIHETRDIDQSFYYYSRCYHDIWQSSSLNRAKTRYDPDKAWKKMNNSLPSDHGSQTIAKIPAVSFLLKIAAVILLILIPGYFYLQNSKTLDIAEYSDSSISSFHVPYGSRSIINLQDGTRVWLNSGSTLSYRMNFGNGYRDVNLEGEAFFEVEKDENKPFRVHAKESVIHVTGTSFNVKAYHDEKDIETTVVEGSVKVFVRPAVENSGITLEADQMLSIRPKHICLPGKYGHQSFDEAPYIATIITLDQKKPAEAVTSWRENRWDIRSERLEDISRRIERRYNVKVIISEDELKDMIFSGAFRDESLEQVLRAISATAPVNYKILNQEVYMYKLN